MTPKTILIVNDDVETVETLKENICLLTSQYNVKTTADGKKALAILENEDIDFMLLDLKLPGMNGLQLLTELSGKGIWLPTIVLSGDKIDGTTKEFQDFGIIEFYKKPFLPEKIVVNMDEILGNKEKADLIKNFSLPAIMQLINMEKRTGIITAKIGKENGRIFFKNGKLMDIKIKGLSSRAALEECMNSLYEEREISIEYIDHKIGKQIDMSLMEMVMEASRINDEKKISPKKYLPGEQDSRQRALENLAVITDLLNSLKEVENYIVTDSEGEILKASSENYNELILNSSIYLWVIGNKISDALHLGKTGSMVYYRSAKKRFIQKFGDFIFILDLTAITKFAIFKKKLTELFDKLVLK